MIPLEFHAHCNNGLAPFNLLEAVKEGVRIVHTAIPPLANGSSQPSIFNVVDNLRALGYQPLVNADVLPPVSEHFSRIAEARRICPSGAPREYDQAWYGHQVPGGMISNLRHQLKLMGKEDKLAAVLDETAQVRAELGYPIMVTPFAQFVGSQAAINVIVGERYKEVTDQVIQYALGLWGKEGGDYMDPVVKAKILDRPRAREIEKMEYPEPSLAEVRKQYGGAHLSDEELLLRFYAGPEFVDALKNAPPRRSYLNAAQTVVASDRGARQEEACSCIYSQGRFFFDNSKIKFHACELTFIIVRVQAWRGHGGERPAVYRTLGARRILRRWYQRHPRASCAGFSPGQRTPCAASVKHQ